MIEKWGQVYAAVGGTLLGAGLGLLANALIPGTWGWSMGVALSCALGSILIFAAIFRWPLPGIRSTTQTVIQDAYALSGEMLEWIGEREAADPINSLPANQAWNYNGSYGSNTMRLWNQKFGVRALAVFDKLTQRGAPQSGYVDRSLAEHPTNPLGIIDLAKGLGAMAASIDKG